METVYAAMLLHKAGKPIEEESLKKILEAAGLAIDKGKIKSTVAALKGVDIEKVLKEATVAAPAIAPAKQIAEEKPVEEKKDEKKSEEEAAAGLGALFG